MENQVFTATAVEDGEDIKVTVTFHKKVQVQDALLTMGTVAKGVIEAGMQLAVANGATREEAVELMGI